MIKHYAAALLAAITVGGTAFAQSPDMKLRCVENGVILWVMPKVSAPRL